MSLEARGGGGAGARERGSSSSIGILETLFGGGMKPDVLGRCAVAPNPWSIERRVGSSGAASSASLSGRLSSAAWSRRGGSPGLCSGSSLCVAPNSLARRPVAPLIVVVAAGGGRTSGLLLAAVNPAPETKFPLGAVLGPLLGTDRSGWNLGFMSVRINGGLASGSGELGSLLGGVLKGDTLSSADSLTLLGASESLTCRVPGGLLKALGLPARLTGGGS
jgi:hypothetical protein